MRSRPESAVEAIMATDPLNAQTTPFIASSTVAGAIDKAVTLRVRAAVSANPGLGCDIGGDPRVSSASRPKPWPGADRTAPSAGLGGLERSGSYIARLRPD